MGAISSKNFSYIFLKYKILRVSYRASMGLSEEGKGTLPTSLLLSLVLGPHSGTAGRCIAGCILFPNAADP